MALQCCRANESGAARISMWKSLSDVVDRAVPMHVAQQQNKETTVLDLEFVLEKG